MRLGVVGVGLMGLAIAQRLRDCGHDVTVNDIDPVRTALAAGAGCTVADAAEAVARASDLVIVVVVDGAQTRDVLFGERGVANAGGARCVMLCPTIAPQDTEVFADRLAAFGVETIDAPMSGGPARAREGRMSLMAACDDATFDRFRPLLGQIAQPVFRVGSRPGHGARTKLVNNLLAAVNLAGACEALALAERLGLDAAVTLGVIEQSSGQSWVGSDRLRRVLAGDARIAAQLSLLAKDSQLAATMARACAAVTPVGDAAAASFAAALAGGLGSEDDAALLRWLQRGGGQSGAG